MIHNNDNCWKIFAQFEDTEISNKVRYQINPNSKIIILKGLVFKIERYPEGFELDIPKLENITRLNSFLVSKFISYKIIENVDYTSGKSIVSCWKLIRGTPIINIFYKIPSNGRLLLIFNLLKGFNQLHSNLIIHGDVSANNVLIQKLLGKYLPKIIDINIWKSNDGNNSLLGSPEYMPPETLEGSNYNISSEIWAIGVLFYFLYLGRFPFGNRNENSFSLQRIIQRSLVRDFTAPINALPDPIKTIVDHCLQPDINNRASNLQDFLKLF